MRAFQITPVDKKLSTALQHKIDQKTKPLGALGRLEELALQIGLIQQSLSPCLQQPTIMVFAGDHGIAREGLVNPYPQVVTTQMVYNFLQGGAAINVFCQQHHIALKVVDAGVNHDFPPHPQLINGKIAKGTQNYLQQAAMSIPECEAALEKGAALVQELHAAGCNILGLGEMGIGNSSAAALIMAAITGLPVEACAGRGTGVNDAQLAIKISTLKRVYAKHCHKQRSALELLSCFGGFEMAMMCGAMLGAAEQKMAIVIDGFISTAALLVAHRLAPAILDYCLFAHHSGEQGHEQMLQYLKAKPLLNLGMRLGEGTGAALAMPLIQAGVAFLNQMASFASAGVDTIAQ